MSYYVEAFTPETDLELQKHKKVLEFCKEVGVSLPEETETYFESRCEDFSIKQSTQKSADEACKVELKKGEHYFEWRDDYYGGYEVDLTKLPSGVTKLRFLIG